MPNPTKNKEVNNFLPDIPPEHQDGVHLLLNDGDEILGDFPTGVSRERIEELRENPTPDPNCPAVHIVMEDGEEQRVEE